MIESGALGLADAVNQHELVRVVGLGLFEPESIAVLNPLGL